MHHRTPLHTATEEAGAWITRPSADVTSQQDTSMPAPADDTLPDPFTPRPALLPVAPTRSGRSPHPEPATMHASSRTRRGLLTEWRTRLFGERIQQLTEETHRAPLMSYLLTATQSLAVVLVLGHAEIPLLFSGNLGVTVLMAGALALRIATVVVADVCALRTLRRLPVLARNRATFAVLAHGAYLAFVLLTELFTYALVLAVLDRNPQGLLSSAPIVPPDGPVYFGLILARAILLSWTAVQLYVVSAPLPLQWATLDHKSMSLLGGHAKAALERLELKQADIASLFQAFAAVSKRPPRRRTWWNGWLMRRDQEAEAAEEAHQQDVIRALEGLSRDHAAEMAAELAALEHARLAAVHAERKAKAAIESATDEAMQIARAQLAEAFLHLIATGKAPEWLAELAPEVAEVLPTLLTKGRRMPPSISARSALHATTNTGASTGGSLDDLRAILGSMGIQEAQKPEGMRRGIWVKSSDIERISGGVIRAEEATHLARRLGNGAKDGRAYVAPLEALIDELAERNKLHSALISWRNARRKRLDSHGDSERFAEAIPA